MDSTPESARWSLPLRLIFRLVFCYFALVNLTFPLEVLPFTGKLVSLYANAWNDGVSWVGAHILHLAQPIAEQANGSGDRLFNWVEQVCYLGYAALATLIWSILDRRRPAYLKLHQWLRILLRYALASAMLSYGILKLHKGQFPFPGPVRLLERVGELSPMGLLWTFMGYSTPYTVFSGAAETLGGVLLFFRRTTTLGALVCAAVMTNVVLLNLSYDVPVKIYSMLLLSMALTIAAPDLRRLLGLLVLGRAVPAADLSTPIPAGWPRAAGMVARWVVAAMLVFNTTKMVRAEIERFQTQASAPLYGIWQVEEYARNGAAVPPLATDATRWNRLLVQGAEFLLVKSMTDEGLGYAYVFDAGKQTLTLSRPADPKDAPRTVLSVARPEPDGLVLSGPMGGAALEVKLRRVPLDSFPLVNRGFRWVNEFPFNR